MPTLAPRNAAISSLTTTTTATATTTPPTATATAMAAIATTTATAQATVAATSNATTMNNDYHSQQQQQHQQQLYHLHQQHQQQLNHPHPQLQQQKHHHPHHAHPQNLYHQAPPYLSHNHHSQHSGQGAAVAAAATIVTDERTSAAATMATTTPATPTPIGGLATFNGNANSSMSNGINSKSLESSSNPDDINGDDILGHHRKSGNIPTHREDVVDAEDDDGNDADIADNGDGDVVDDRQLAASNNNGESMGASCGGGGGGGQMATNSNGRGGNIAKGSKENLLQSYCNGADIAGSGPPPLVASSSSGQHHHELDDPGDGLGPLPPKWETAYTERGEMYFIDHNTGTSHWLDPRLSKFQKKSLEDCRDDELPYGWEKIEDSLYGTYYIDHVNRRTQYENPVLEAKRRAAEQKQKQLQQHHHHQQQQQQQQPGPSHHQRPQTPSMYSGSSASTLAVGAAHPSNAGDISQRAMQPPPPPLPPSSMAAGPIPDKSPLLPYKFTRNPSEMQGERITTTLVKSVRGLGITIVGGDDGIDEFLQIKSIVPNGPAWLDGQLLTGDILVYVNDTCVLGFSHHDMVNVFQSIVPGESVTLEVCRGYALPFDPNDPNTEVVTTIAVDAVNKRPDVHADGNYNFLDNSGDGVGGGKGRLLRMGGGGGGAYHREDERGVEASSSNGFILMKKPEALTFSIVKGAMGFGFTIADSAYGQKVKKILDRNCCTQLREGDILLEINNEAVRHKSHLEVVQILKDCSKTMPTTVKIQRSSGAPTTAMGYETNGGVGVGGGGGGGGSGNVAKLRKNFLGNTMLFRSKTPTADLYSTQQKEILPIRPKTPLVDTRNRARVKTPNNELNNDAGESHVNGKSTNSLQEIDDAINQDIPPFMDPYPKLVSSLSERLANTALRVDPSAEGLGSAAYGYGNAQPPVTAAMRSDYDAQEYVTASGHSGNFNSIYGLSTMPPTMAPLYTPSTPLSLLTPSGQPSSSTGSYHLHHESCYCYECQDFRANKYRQHQSTGLNFYGHPPSNNQYAPAASLQAAHMQNERMQKRVNELLNDRRKVGFSPVETHYDGHNATQQHSPSIGSIISQQQQHHQQQHQSQQQSNTLAWNGNGANGGGSYNSLGVGGTLLDALPDGTEQYDLSEVTLERQALGFGFRIVGGTEEGSQVTVGHVVPGGAADNDHRITTGDEILSIDGINVVNSSHHKVVSLMGEAALRGRVTMILRRRRQASAMITPPMPQHLSSYPYDVIVSRNENEGFGFVIISSTNQYQGSTIGKLIPGSPADRCGELRVGDCIVAVNRINIAGMSHGDVVNLIKESGLHVRLTIGCPLKEQLMSGGAIVSNSAQASPGQLSQTQLSTVALHLQQQQQQQQHQQEGHTFYDHPKANVAGLSTPHQQQSQTTPQL